VCISQACLCCVCFLRQCACAHKFGERALEEHAARLHSNKCVCVGIHGPVCAHARVSVRELLRSMLPGCTGKGVPFVGIHGAHFTCHTILMHGALGAPIPALGFDSFHCNMQRLRFVCVALAQCNATWCSQGSEFWACLVNCKQHALICQEQTACNDTSGIRSVPRISYARLGTSDKSFAQCLSSRQICFAANESKLCPVFSSPAFHCCPPGGCSTAAEL